MKGSQDKVGAMIAQAAQSAAAQLIEEFEFVRCLCESPIEELMLAALFVHSKEVGYPGLHFCTGENISDRPAFDEAAFIYPQASIGPYRVDFLIHDVTCPLDVAPPRWVVVECDGHDFHERTKEQAKRDKQRDRFLQSKGYKVLRFTGSELWADAEKCAEEVIDQLGLEGRGR